MDRADDVRRRSLDEPLDLEVTLFERAYAVLLGAIVRQDETGDVARAWLVADMVVEIWETHGRR